MAFAAAAVAAVLLGMLVVRLQTPGGEVTLSTDDPDIEVVVKGGGALVRIIDRKSNQAWHLDANKYQLGMADQPNGLTVPLEEGKSLTLHREGKAVLTVARTAAPARNDLPDAPGFIRTVTRPSRKTDFGPMISRDGRLLMVGVESQAWQVGAVRVVEVATGKVVRELGHHGHEITDAAFTPDGKHVLTGTTIDRKTYRFRLWDLETGEDTPLDQIEPSAWWPCQFQFSADGKRFVTMTAPPAGKQYSRAVYDVPSGKMLARIDPSDDSPAYHLYTVLAADGSRAVSACQPRGPDVPPDAASRIRITALDGGEDRVIDASLSPARAPFLDQRAGKVGAIFRDAEDRTVIQSWDLATGKPNSPIRVTDNKVHSADGTSDGRRFVIVGEREGKWVARVLDAAGREVFQTSLPPGDAKLSEDGRVLLTWDDSDVRVYRLPDRPAADQVGVVRRVQVPGTLYGAAIAPDHGAFAVGSFDGVTVFDAAGGKRFTLPGNLVRYTGDGKWLVTGKAAAEGDQLGVYEAATGKAVRTFGKLGAELTHLWVLPGDRRLVTLDARQMVRLWDAGSGEEVGRWQLGDGGFTWSPDGTRLLLLVAGEERCRVLDTETGREVVELTSLVRDWRSLRTWMGGGLGIIAFNDPTDPWIVDPATGHKLHQGKSMPEGDVAGAWLPDCTGYLYAFSDGTLRVLEGGMLTELARMPFADAPAVIGAAVDVTPDQRYAVVCTKRGGAFLLRLPEFKRPGKAGPKP